MLQKVRKLPCHSLRDLLCIIIAVAVLSALVTYQLTSHIPMKSQAELTILLEERNFHVDKRRGLEGIDLEKDSRISQSDYSRQWERKNHLDIQTINAKIKKIEDEWFGRSGECNTAVVQADTEEKQQTSGAVVIQTSTHFSHAQLFQRLNCQVTVIKEKDIKVLKRGDNSIVWIAGLMNMTDDTSSQLYAVGTKVNRIPVLEETLKSQESLCEIMQELSHVSDVNVESITPSCYILPKQYHEFLRMENIYGHNKKWIYKKLGPGFGRITLLDMKNSLDAAKIDSWSIERSMLQEYFGPPLLFYGMPFEMKAYVLVTSLSPLRAYVHTEGVVQSRHDYQKYFQKIDGRTWRFSQLRVFISNTHGSQTAEVMFYNLHSLILQHLLILDIKAFNTQKQNRTHHIFRCEECFQLLQFDIIFNTSFHPVILDINLIPKMDTFPQQQEILKDVVSILTADIPVYKDVAVMYRDLNFHLETKNDACFKKEGHLSEKELRYIMVTRKEYLSRGKFKMIYPAANGDRYTAFINALNIYYLHERPTQYKSEKSVFHSTVDLHSTLLAIMKYFSNRDVLGDSYDDLTMFHTPSEVQSGLFHHVNNKDSHSNTIYTRKFCSQDADSMLYLQSFHTEPHFNFTPVFRANVTDYYATVPYDVLYVKVWGFAQYCHSEARLEHKYGVARPSLYTLGLGLNQLLIHVVDISHTDPWIANTYTLNIQRESPDGWNKQDETSDTVIKACTLIQDCDLKYIAGAPCGLQNSTFHSWVDFLTTRAKLPSCVSGDVPGEWVFPCVSCSDRQSCEWDEGVWQPLSCTHTVLPKHKLKTCLAGKQVLFIGDSTNRGIMHYVMEKVNDSLTEWDKTHDIKLYSNINDDSTSFSFGYYPQFWLPVNQRPVFDKALYELLKQCQPVENNHNTVLVVGGVHWLATHHLNVLAEALKREALSGVKVVMKGLGAGFHQPVDGLHCLTLRDQRKLLLHNQGLLRLARKLGYGVVDTFNMTMARYKDFLQGKCACHFHNVKEILPSFTEFLRSTSHGGQSGYSDMPIHYHIEGQINKAYSEILINYLCDQYTQ